MIADKSGYKLHPVFIKTELSNLLFETIIFLTYEPWNLQSLQVLSKIKIKHLEKSYYN